MGPSQKCKRKIICTQMHARCHHLGGNLNYLYYKSLLARIRALPSAARDKWGVWYMHLKIENMCLKTCVEIRVDEKVCKNTCNV